MANKKFKDNNTLDSSQVYDAKQSQTLNNILARMKVIQMVNVLGTTYMEKTFTVQNNSSVLVLCSTGLLYTTFLYNPSNQSFYIGANTYLSGTSDNFTISMTDAKQFTLRIPAYASATLIFNFNSY